MNIINKYKSLSKEVKASVSYTICNILTKCLSLLTLPIFTRMMTTEEYGLVTVYTSTAAVVVIFTSLQLPYGSLSTAMIKFKDDREGYLSSLCSITAILTIGYMILCYVFQNTMEQYLDLPIGLIILMGIEMLFTTSRVAWMGYQRFEYRYRNVVIITLLTSMMSVLASLVAVIIFRQKGVAKICANAIVVCVIGFLIFFFLIKKGKRPFEKKYWKFAFTFNIPLIPYYLSQVIFNQSDRLMINKICGRSDAAMYGVAYSIATILVFVVSSIHSSYTPWIFERIEKKELQENRKISLILSSGIAFMLLGIIALAPEVVRIMAGDQYTDAIWVIPPVTMSVLLLYYSDLFDCFLFFYEAKFFLAIAAVASASVNIILNYFFIPKYGFVAAGYTTLISYAFLAWIDYLYMLKICKKHDIDKKVYSIKGLIGVFGIFSAVGFLVMSLYRLPIVRYSIILGVFLILYIFRKKIMKNLNLLKDDLQ